MAEKLKVLGVSGSLRKGSFNTAALRAAIELAPPDMTIEPFDLRPIPLYDEDVKERGFPPPVQELREKIRAADALLIVTPEYNYSVPGVLKNAIDWASRPPEHPFEGKPIGLFGASPGALGTARAQYHLRQCFIFLNAPIMLRPEVMIAAAAGKFADGKLTDQPTRDVIAAFLVALAAWARRFAKA